MICEFCKEGELVQGTLVGVSFEPSTKKKKWIASGVYGIKAVACTACGRLSDLSLDTEALRKTVKG